MVATEGNRRTEQRDKTAAKLKLAARTLIQERGFAETTVRAIAQKSKVSVGTVMAHFGSKEDLLFAVFHEDLGHFVLEAIAKAQSRKSLDKRLEIFATTMLQSLSKDPHVYGDLMRRALFASGEWSGRFEKQVHDAAMQIAGWYAADGVPPSDIESSVLSFVSFYYFILLQQLKSDFADLDSGLSQLRKMLKLHVRGLS